jgi:hypothetical protein
VLGLGGWDAADGLILARGIHACTDPITAGVTSTQSIPTACPAQSARNFGCSKRSLLVNSRKNSI